MMIQDKEFIKFLNIQGKILDVGSLDVNGNIKGLLNGFYTGMDIRKGKNVDVQANSHNLPFKSGIFDNVISIGTLEHDTAFWFSIKEIWRVLKIGGKLILSIPNYKFQLHQHPQDYWRFSEDAVQILFNRFNEVTFWKSKVNDDCLRVYGIK